MSSSTALLDQFFDKARKSGSQLARRWKDSNPWSPRNMPTVSRPPLVASARVPILYTEAHFPTSESSNPSLPTRPGRSLFFEEKRFRVEPCLRLGLVVAREASALRRPGRGVGYLPLGRSLR